MSEDYTVETTPRKRGRPSKAAMQAEADKLTAENAQMRAKLAQAEAVSGLDSPQLAKPPEPVKPEGSGLAFLPTDIHVDPLDRRSNTRIVTDKVKEVLGADVYVFLASTLKPQRLADLSRFGYVPLRWSDLNARQQRELGRLLPVRPDDLCRYGDAIVTVASVQAAAARKAYKDAQRMRGARENEARIGSAQQLKREIGLPGVDVDDRF